MSPQNPYVAGNPVGNSRSFVGRADILREVLRVLRDPERHAIVLHGQRRIGKTSILQHLVSSLRTQHSGIYRPIYFDLQDKAKWSLGDVLVDQARGIASALGLPTPVPDGDPAAWFRTTWLPSVLANLSPETSLVILFDEFDVLADARAEHAASAFFPFLRQLLEEAQGRVRLVFVIGRNIDDLANIAHALFKSLPAERVGLFARDDAEVLMRLAEANGTMAWEDAAIDRAWALTSGHPFLLQQLCWELWEKLHEDEGPASRATVADVDQVAARTLDSAVNVFEWIWKGLPPAQRVVASALAGAGANAISQEALEKLLLNSGVRVVIRELRDAPQLLEDWDLIEPAGGGYRFRVELLRRWIAKTKPLARVQKELDSIEPIAENLYRAGEGHYKAGALDAAAGLLRQARGLNPNHLRASELLADILIATREWTEARHLLEQLHEYNPPAARGRLVQVLMELTDSAGSEEDRLALLERVLKVQRHPEAEAARRQIWIDRGDRARSAGQLEEAASAYQEAGSADLHQSVLDELLRMKLDDLMRKLAGLERTEQFAKALEAIHEAGSKFDGLKDWGPEVTRLTRAAEVSASYHQAVGALAKKDEETGIRLLAGIISVEPRYKDAAKLLYEAVSGVATTTTTAQLGDELQAHAEAARASSAVKQKRLVWALGVESAAIVGLVGWYVLSPTRSVPAATSAVPAVSVFALPLTSVPEPPQSATPSVSADPPPNQAPSGSATATVAPPPAARPAEAPKAPPDKQAPCGRAGASCGPQASCCPGFICATLDSTCIKPPY